MPTFPNPNRPVHASARSAPPLAAAALLVFVSANMYLLGWVVPSVATRSESTAPFQVSASAVFGNAPTVNRKGYAGSGR